MEKMKFSFIGAILAVGMVAMVLGCYQPETKEGGDYQPNPNRHVLFIGWDGVRPDTIEVANTPNIDKLRSDNAIYSTGEVGGKLYQQAPADWELPTEAGDWIFNPYHTSEFYQSTSSWPGWSSILTGTYANKNGVEHSYEGAVSDGLRPYEDYPPFVEYIKDYSLNTFVGFAMSWTPLVSDAIDPTRADYIYKTIRVDAAIPGAVNEMLNNSAVVPTVIFTDFDRTDWWGHDSGFSPGDDDDNVNVKTIEYIEQADAWLGQMVESVENRIERIKEKTGVTEEWLIVFTADHGGYDRDGDPTAPIKATKKPRYRYEFDSDEEYEAWKAVPTIEDMEENWDDENSEWYKSKGHTYFSFWWDSNPKKGGDHGNWQSGPQFVKEEDYITIRTMANSSRYVPLLIWSNIATKEIDDRFGNADGSNGLENQKADQTNSRYDLRTRNIEGVVGGTPGIAPYPTHHVVDIVPTMFDFLDIPYGDLDLDGKSIFRKTTSDKDSVGANYKHDYSTWLGDKNDTSDENRGTDFYWSTEEEKQKAKDNGLYYARNGMFKKGIDSSKGVSFTDESSPACSCCWGAPAQTAHNIK